MKTEQEMRAESAPWPDSLEELNQYVESLVKREHDYGTAVYAMSLAATATLNFVGKKLGVTGFQASCADLDIVRRNRGIKGPFILLKADDALYPQYDLMNTLQESMDKWRGWLSKQATIELKDCKDEPVHPNVKAHWEKLATYKGKPTA